MTDDYKFSCWIKKYINSAFVKGEAGKSIELHIIDQIPSGYYTGVDGVMRYFFTLATTNGDLIQIATIRKELPKISRVIGVPWDFAEVRGRYTKPHKVTRFFIEHLFACKEAK